VTHRDIKLENCLLDGRGNVKIADFGLAAVSTAGALLTVHCGSPSYAAPEIVGRRPYEGPPADVWSLGVVTYAMLCGHLPFQSRNGAGKEGAEWCVGEWWTGWFAHGRVCKLPAEPATAQGARS